MNERDETFIKEHNYQYLETIGIGGYGFVYLVYDFQYNQNFAIKVISKSKFRQNEIDCMIQLDDPNIVNLYKYYFYEDSVYMVMEYCPSSVEKLIKPDGVSERIMLYKYALEIVKSINACHSRNIAHYDIKPSNFLIDTSGRIKAADFGFSTHSTNGELSHIYAGSLPFMAPEILDRKPHDPFKADVWSLGVTLFTLATGRLPWFGKSKQELISSILACNANMDLIEDRDYSRLISSCLSLDPKQRPDVSTILNSPIFQKLEQIRSQMVLKSKSSVQISKHIIKPRIKESTSNINISLFRRRQHHFV